MAKLWDKGIQFDKKIESFTVGNDNHLDSILIPVSYTHLTQPTILRV